MVTLRPVTTLNKVRAVQSGLTTALLLHVGVYWPFGTASAFIVSATTCRDQPAFLAPLHHQAQIMLQDHQQTTQYHFHTVPQDQSQTIQETVPRL